VIGEDAQVLRRAAACRSCVCEGTKGQLVIDILAEAFADGVRLDFVCGDEVYGSCTELREYLEDQDQGAFPVSARNSTTIAAFPQLRGMHLP
jgi:hypothetical protein